MDDDDFSSEGTLSPDMIDTILDDARRQVVAGARQLGINPEAANDEAEAKTDQD